MSGSWSLSCGRTSASSLVAHLWGGGVLCLLNMRTHWSTVLRCLSYHLGRDLFSSSVMSHLFFWRPLGMDWRFEVCRTKVGTDKEAVPCLKRQMPQNSALVGRGGGRPQWNGDPDTTLSLTVSATSFNQVGISCSVPCQLSLAFQ